jgi:hypothetical protein
MPHVNGTQLSAVTDMALLYNVRKVCGLAISTNSCCLSLYHVTCLKVADLKSKAAVHISRYLGARFCSIHTYL